MTIKPSEVLIGDTVEVEGKVARVRMIYELWTGEYRFILACPVGKYNYVYKCTDTDRITLPRGIG